MTHCARRLCCRVYYAALAAAFCAFVNVTHVTEIFTNSHLAQCPSSVGGHQWLDHAVGHGVKMRERLIEDELLTEVIRDEVRSKRRGS